MTRPPLLLSFLFPGLLLSPAPAQTSAPFDMTARIARIGSPPPVCSPFATHVASCAGVFLQPGKGVDLRKWEGRTVELKGGIGFGICPTIRVTSVRASQHGYDIRPDTGGGYRLGEYVTFETRSPFLTLVPFLIAGKPSLIPIPLGQSGTFNLDLLSLHWVRNDLALFGLVRHRIRIPNDLRLIGVEIHGQGAWIGLSGQGIRLRFLNTDCFKILAAK